MITHALNLVGLSLQLIGSALLFQYGLPERQFGNAMLIGKTLMQFEDDTAGEPDLWHRRHAIDRYLQRATILNRTGFALICFGTLLQMIAASL